MQSQNSFEHSGKKTSNDEKKEHILSIKSKKFGEIKLLTTVVFFEGLIDCCFSGEIFMRYMHLAETIVVSSSPSVCFCVFQFFIYKKFTGKLILGSWTYGGLEVDLKHKDLHKQRVENETVAGINGGEQEQVWIVEDGQYFY